MTTNIDTITRNGVPASEKFAIISHTKTTKGNAMFTIPFTQYQEFSRIWNKTTEFEHLRFGQAFYNYADLHKMTQTPFLDKLYNATSGVAEKMLLDIIDYAN